MFLHWGLRFHRIGPAQLHYVKFWCQGVLSGKSLSKSVLRSPPFHCAIRFGAAMTEKSPASESSSSISRKRRGLPRWLKVVLTTVLVLVALVISLHLWRSNSASQQRDAVASLKKARAIVKYDFQYNPHDHEKYQGTFRSDHPSYPKGLVKTFGVDYFSNVASINYGKHLSYVDLSPLQNTPYVKDLWLDESRRRCQSKICRRPERPAATCSHVLSNNRRRDDTPQGITGTRGSEAR